MDKQQLFQLVDEAIAIHVDTEGMEPDDVDAIENAIYWLLTRLGHEF